MIYFVTTRTDHDPLIYRSEKVVVETTVDHLDQYLTGEKFAGCDTEYNNDGRFFTCDVLLLSIGNNPTNFVLDWGCSLQSDFIRVLNKHAKRLLVFGHNFKADLTVLGRYGIFFPKVYDTMVSEQRIGLGREDMTANFVDTYYRRLGKIYQMAKDLRTDFITMTPASKFKYDHIPYSAGDVGELHDIAVKQRTVLQQMGSYDWFINVENRLTPVLASMELEGVHLDEDKWKVILAERKEDKAKTELDLDQYLHKTGKFAVSSVLQPGLFDTIRASSKHLKHMNYGSSPQVLKAIRKLGHLTPVYKEKGKKVAKPSLRIEAIQPYIIENPGCAINPFLETLVEYKEHSKFISSYGTKFFNYTIRKKSGTVFGYKNSVTQRVHTYYKQCETETGRLASGDVDRGLYNSQQLPGEENVRNSFTLTQAEIQAGWCITTCDLAGAELIIMAALADDQHLYSLGMNDLHSPIATKCWRAVYKFRLNQFVNNYGEQALLSITPEKLNKYLTITDTKGKKYVLTADFIVDKKTNEQLRTDFKSNTFGTIYGMMDAKCGQTLNIPKNEARVVLDVIRNEFPKTFKMVKQASDYAFADGYVEFNNRSHNRRWFSPVLTMLDENTYSSREVALYTIKKELPFFLISQIDGAARNCRIQGTQADMIKESMVNVQHAIDQKNIPAKLLLSVHDELVVKHKGIEFGNDIKEIMANTANLYLAPYSDNIRMGADHHTLLCWTKGKYKGPNLIQNVA